jgi:ATP-dependent helicase STH1/SNF2
MVEVIHAQIQAFRYVSRNLPIPEQFLRAIRLSSSSVPDIEKILRTSDPATAAVAEAAVQMHKGSSQPPEGAPTATAVTKGVDDSQADAAVKVEESETQIEPADMPKGPFLEDDVHSGIYPYNAYQHPFTHLKRPADMDPVLFATRLQRLIIPTIMPAGLDAHQILEERDRFIEARIRQRIRELEDMPSTMGDGGLDSTLDGLASESKDKDRLVPFLHPPNTAHGKLRALIELKSLKVAEKQRALRALVAERLTHGSLLPLNRADFRRVRRPTIRDARTTEQLERKQRAERERRAKHKHVEQLNVICEHGRAMIAAARAAQDRVYRLGRAVQSLHVITEKEEQKRIERISKERLKALKADDEEAYMRLIDTAKDTRITHLLRQTDAYLDSLAQAVAAQQADGGQDFGFETEEGPASEATFGAQVTQEDATEEKAKVDYYAVAHKISEKVSRQPTILTGGTLKEYQLKGLQWMVSLYNNRLNGILADEMVFPRFFQLSKILNLCFRVSGKQFRRYRSSPS